MRNAGSKINTDLSGLWAESINQAMIFRSENNPSAEFVRYSDIMTTFDNDLSRSLIVIGADIYVDVDVTMPPLLLQSRALISLKNNNGQWGNIWVRWSVRTIESSLFTEGSIFSGEEYVSGTLSPYYISKKSLFLDLPNNQLYIHGTVWGYNTIGWSSKSGWAVCPYLNDNSAGCTYDNSLLYDLNYFRVYDGDPAGRAYKNDSKDAFSVIVEYDSRTLQDPPPWLETIN